MNRFQKWALATTFATYVLIMVGGLVRAADAGLGCPDWPKCFGRYYPPFNESQIPGSIDASKFDFQLAWIEYTNRFVGVLVGLLILGMLYHAVKLHRGTPTILYPTIAAFALVAFEGWLGGELVRHELQPWHITAHYILALIIVGCLLYATISAFFPEARVFADLPPQRRTLATLVVVVLSLTVFQAGLGTELRGQLEVVEKNSPNLPRHEWIHHVDWVDPVHRSFSWLIIAGVAGIIFYIYRRLHETNRWLRLAAYSAAILVGVQIAAGIGLAYGALPPPLQVVHLFAGSLFIGVLMSIYLLASRVPVEKDGYIAANRPQTTLSEQVIEVFAISPKSQ